MAIGVAEGEGLGSRPGVLNVDGTETVPASLRVIDGEGVAVEASTGGDGVSVGVGMGVSVGVGVCANAKAAIRKAPNPRLAMKNWFRITRIKMGRRKN
jgi:hypothetical protein